MKKSFKIAFIPILVVILTAGIFIVLYYSIFKNESEIKSFVVTNDNIILEIGDTKDLKECYTIAPASASIYVMCYINDASFAEISEDNVIIAKSIGETKILLKCSINNKLVQEEINLIIVEKSIIPNSFNFENEKITLSPTTTNCYNRIICDEAYNVTPLIEYSNSNICEYNYTTGLITPINLGTTIITVKFSKDNKIISNSFTVKVEENYITLETNLTKEGEYYILLLNKNSNGYFTVKSFESGVENAKIKLKNEFVINQANVSILQFESNIVILKATSIGESILKIYLEEDESVFVNIKIKVS